MNTNMLNVKIPTLAAPILKPTKYIPKLPKKSSNLYKKVEIFDPIKKEIKHYTTSYLQDIINLKFHNVKKISAIQGRVQVFEIEGSQDRTIEVYLQNVKSTAIRCLNENRNKKMNFTLSITIKRTKILKHTFGQKQ
jgi:hypothetical protein